MLQPGELKLRLPMEVGNGVISTTTKVWEILVANRKGKLESVKQLVAECPELIYAQYNYAPQPGEIAEAEMTIFSSACIFYSPSDY